MSIDKEQFDAMARSVRAGDYSLLVGAGASYGCLNGQGVPLPLGDDYRQELCAIKGAPRSTSLQKVFQTLDEDEFQEHVVRRFLNCTTNATLNAIPKFIWKRVFSLNIDDALEAAYGQLDRFQDPLTKNFRDSYEDVREVTTLPIVHLHGWVRRSNQGFVFSREEYIRQIKTINPWMVVLTEELAVSPFIIMGTSLDEVDLDFYLSQRTHVSSRVDRGPSILVEMQDTVITRKDCEKYNLVQFEGTAEDFMRFLLTSLRNRPTPRGMIAEASQSLFPETVSISSVSKFMLDFEIVPSIAAPSLEDARFLRGHEPSWSDLAANLDISREQTPSLVSSIDNLLEEGPTGPTLIYLYDLPGGGKSTVLRRIAYDYAKRGLKTLLCSSLSRLETEFTSSMIDNIDVPLLIVVDDFADQAHAVAQIGRGLEKADVVFLVSGRSYRHRYIMQAVAGLRLMPRSGALLNSREALGLIDNYTEAGFLGAQDARDNPKKFADQIRSDPIAVACCRIMNEFRSLDDIIDSFIAASTKTEVRRYLAAAIGQHCLSSGLRYETVVRVASGIGLQSQLQSTHALPLAFSDPRYNEYIVPANATIAARFLRLSAVRQPELVLELFVAIARSLASRVNRQAIRTRSPEARLAGRLFDFDQVVFEFLRENSIRFYVDVESDWRWNSRYWEQVALLYLGRYQASGPDSDSADLQLAVTHARHAVVIERHPFTLTTLGKILLAMMHSRDRSATSAFEEAFSMLCDAIDLERSWLRSNAQPYVTLFRGVREYQTLGFELDVRQKASVLEYLRYARTAFGADQDMSRMLDELHAHL